MVLFDSAATLFAVGYGKVIVKRRTALCCALMKLLHLEAFVQRWASGVMYYEG